MMSPLRFGLVAILGLVVTLSLQGCDAVADQARSACKHTMEHVVKGAKDSFTKLATTKCKQLSDTVDHVHNATGESIRTKCLASIENIANNDSDNYISQWTSSCDEHVSNETDGNESESHTNSLANLFSQGSNLKKELDDHWTEMWDKVYVSFKETSEESETGASVDSEKDTPEDSEKHTPEGESEEPETGTSDDSAKGTPQDSEKDSQKGASDEEESDSDDSEKSTSKDSDKSKDSEKSDAKDKTLKLFDDSIHKDESGFRVTTPTLLGASLLLVSGLVVLRSWGAGRGLVGGEEELEHLAELESVEA